MALKKIKLPDETVVEIQDSRVPGVDTTPTSGSANLITSGGVYAAIPTKTSDLTNDSGFMTGMTILSYGHSTWQDFMDAYTDNKVVYCRASSNANPATGVQSRMAFMAYVGGTNQASPTNVEFQYYRSVSSHTVTQQGDQVFVYTLKSNGTWSVITREATAKVVAGTGLTSSYANDTLTLNATAVAATATPLMDGTAAVGTATKYAREDHVHPSDSSKANDSAVVHNTGNESIAGYKTFSDDVTIEDDSILIGGGSGFSWIQDENGDSVQDALNGKEASSNKVTSLSSSSTDTQYPSAKCVYNNFALMLPLAGGTMTGDITMPAGEFIMSPGGYAMCGMDSNGTTFYCGPGDEVTNSFRLRSGNINLTHYKSGTPYTVFDASNSNLSTVDWATKELSIAGKTSHTSGHIYLEGAQATSSTGNTTQLIFGTSTTNHVSITSNTSAIVINPTSSTTTGQIVLGTNSKNTTFSSSGKFGIGTVSPSEKLSVSGNIVATGTITPGSDSRIKNNQKEISKEDAFSVIENLKPKTWTWNEKSNENLEGKVAAGLVAQEVKEILPEAVTIAKTEDFEDFHSLNYNTIQGYEIAAIKGLLEEIKSLKTEIVELKNKLNNK